MVMSDPGDRTSDSVNLILPGMSMSNKWILRCVATSSPLGLNVRDVLYSLSVLGSRSGMEPPTRYVEESLAMADRAVKDCEDPGGESDSAYLGKNEVPYGELKHSFNQKKKIIVS